MSQSELPFGWTCLYSKSSVQGHLPTFNLRLSSEISQERKGKQSHLIPHLIQLEQKLQSILFLSLTTFTLHRIQNKESDRKQKQCSNRIAQMYTHLLQDPFKSALVCGVRSSPRVGRVCAASPVCCAAGERKDGVHYCKDAAFLLYLY